MKRYARYGRKNALLPRAVLLLGWDCWSAVAYYFAICGESGFEILL